MYVYIYMYMYMYIYIHTYIHIHTYILYIHIYICIYIYIHILCWSVAGSKGGGSEGYQDSSKGGAVEIGCSELYDVILLVVYIILPQSTAPPCNEYPG